MNEINIYARYNHKKLIKNANLFFLKKYKWYCPRSVIAPFDGNFTLAIFKNNIHISYWNENLEQSRQEKLLLKRFLEEYVSNMNIVIDYDNPCEITSLLKKINTLI